MEKIVDWPMAILTALHSDWPLVLVTALMLIVTLHQAHKSSQVFLAQTMLSFLNDYSSLEMREAFDRLAVFRDENPELMKNLNDLFFCSRGIKALDGSHMELARRYIAEFEPSIGVERSKVSWFFNKAWRLKRYGFIDRRTLKTICGLDGALIFMEVACPMTLAIRLVKIHKCDNRAFLRDPSVRWYAEFYENMPLPKRLNLEVIVSKILLGLSRVQRALLRIPTSKKLPTSLQEETRN